MSMQDPVADMLTILRNAQSMGIPSVSLPHSEFKSDILKVLHEEGFINSYDVSSIDDKKRLNVTLKYYEGRPVIEKIKRVSRPALRVYAGYKEIPLVRGGLGISIISTPKGVMSDKVARTLKVGGEVLCTVE